MNDKYQHINELIDRIKNKDTDALSELFDFYKPLFLSSIKRCIAKEPKFSEYKEDMLQESFFVLEKLVNDYDPDLTYFSYFISTRIDLMVLFGYLSYYYMLGRIQNRPRYVTDLGKLIVFPIPSALGAFTGYKLSYIIQGLL